MSERVTPGDSIRWTGGSIHIHEDGRWLSFNAWEPDGSISPDTLIPLPGPEAHVDRERIFSVLTSLRDRIQGNPL